MLYSEKLEDKDILKMSETQIRLYSYSIENIRMKIDDIVDLGYTREEVIRMTKLLPSLFCYNIENIKNKISIS